MEDASVPLLDAEGGAASPRCPARPAGGALARRVLSGRGAAAAALAAAALLLAATVALRQLPPRPPAGKDSSRLVRRSIVPSVEAALAEALRQRGVTAAAQVVGADQPASGAVATALGFAGITLHRVSNAAEAATFAALGTAVGGALRHEPLGLAVLLVEADGGPPATAERALFKALSHGIPAPRATVHVVVAATNAVSPAPAGAAPAAARALANFPAGGAGAGRRAAAGEKHVWFRESREHLAELGRGEGEHRETTAGMTVRGALLGVIRRHRVSSLLDASCGRMDWMPLVLAEAEAADPSFRFHGAGAACGAIAQHARRWANQTAWAFSCLDFANEPLAGGYDLVFARGLLESRTRHDVWQFLNNVRASGARYLLVSSSDRVGGGNLGGPAAAAPPSSSPPSASAARPRAAAAAAAAAVAAEATDAASAPQAAPQALSLLAPPFNARPPLEEYLMDGGGLGGGGERLALFDVAAMEWDDTLEGLV